MRIINTALCSYGMSGKFFHAPFINAHPGFNLYAVWERSKKTAKENYPAIISFHTLEDLLADQFIQLIVVNTPNYTHYEFAKKALLADKHVLVEKSFTVTVSEAQDLIRIAGEKNKVLSVFHNRRYDSDFKTVKQIVEEGSLGEIKEAEFHFDRYNLNLSPKQHKETANPGAGLLYDLGPHIIDQALCLFGMPLSLFGYLRILRPLSVVNDFFDIQLFYATFSVRLKGSLVVKDPPAAYSIHGINGSFVKERADNQEDILKTGQKPGEPGWGIEPAGKAGTLTLHKDGHTDSKKIQSLPGNYMEFYDELYDAIIHHKMPPVSGKDGLNTMQIIGGVQQSYSGKAMFFFDRH